MLSTHHRDTFHNDVIEAISNWRSWSYLAWVDTRMRYRRSLLGPWWITLSMAIFIALIGAVYGQLFTVERAEYLPFLASGFIFWNLMLSTISEAPTLFVAQAPMIKDSRCNFIAITFRYLCRNLFVFLHNLIILVVVLVLFPSSLSLNFFWFLPAFLLLAVNLSWVTLALAMLGARFRDVPPIINSLLQVLFFVTPIVWMPERLADHEWIYQINPIAHWIDLLRSPFTGVTADPFSWWLSIIAALSGTLFTMLAYKLHKNKIAFWL